MTTLARETHLHDLNNIRKVIILTVTFTYKMKLNTMGPTLYCYPWLHLEKKMSYNDRDYAKKVLDKDKHWYNHFLCLSFWW